MFRPIAFLFCLLPVALLIPQQRFNEQNFRQQPSNRFEQADRFAPPGGRQQGPPRGAPQASSQDEENLPLPPKECQLPFGEAGTLSNGTNPFNIQVSAIQLGPPKSGNDLKDLKGADLEVTITYTSRDPKHQIAGTAVRPGLPFPVGEWSSAQLQRFNSNPTQYQGKILPCLHPESADTLLVLGNFGTTLKWDLTPFLAAWNNKDSRKVTFEVGTFSTSNEIWIELVEVDVAIKETGYTVPEELLLPDSPQLPANENEQFQNLPQNSQGGPQQGRFPPSQQSGGQRFGQQDQFSQNRFPQDEFSRFSPQQAQGADEFGQRQRFDQRQVFDGRRRQDFRNQGF